MKFLRIVLTTVVIVIVIYALSGYRKAYAHGVGSSDIARLINYIQKNCEVFEVRDKVKVTYDCSGSDIAAGTFKDDKVILIYAKEFYQQES